MFPLGTVLVPHAVLPLHVFEARYRALVHDVLAGGREFGVVLIERGSEVGGGDVRTGLGTVARVVEAAEQPDGRWYLVAVGTRRLRVTAWLADDPYPRAEVELLDETEPGPGAGALRAAVDRRLRRVLALRAEAGEPVPPPDFALAPDPALAVWHALAVAGLNPLDTHAVLADPTPEDRLRRLARLLDEAADTLAFRLGT